MSFSQVLTRGSRLPSRLNPLSRLRSRGGYLWRNNGSSLVRWIRRHWDVRAWASQPVVRSDLGGLSITYAGLKEGQAYTLEFIEQRRENPIERTAIRTSRWMYPRELLRASQSLDSDITIIGTTAGNAWRLPRHSSFILPMRVHFVVDYDDGLEIVTSRIARGEQRNFRQRCRQHFWELQIETDPAWFDYFYDNIYRATMAARHGDRERVESKESAYECLFRDGILFVLTMDGERVGGHLCHWDDRQKILTSRLLGVRDGAEKYYAAGALKVMHFLLIRWAGNHGVRKFDLQGTEAFLSKGTYQLKRLYGTRVALPPNHFGDKRLWLQVRRDTPQVRDFLAANPFLALTTDSKLEAVYFYDEMRKARTGLKSNSAGIERTRLIHLDDFMTLPNIAPSHHP